MIVIIVCCAIGYLLARGEGVALGALLGIAGQWVWTMALEVNWPIVGELLLYTVTGQWTKF